MLNSTLLKRSFLTIATHGLARTLAIIVFIILSHLLSVENYGYFIYGNSIGKLIAVIALFGCFPVFVKYWGKSSLDHEKKIKIIFQTLNWYKIIGLIFILMSIFGFFLYTQFKYESSGNIAFISFLIVIPLFLVNLYQQFFNSIKKSIQSGLLQTFFYLIWLFFIGYSYFFNMLNIQWILIGSFIILTLYMLFIIFFHFYKFGTRTERPQYINHNFIVGQWAACFFIYIDIILIEILLSPTDIAFYGVVVQIVSVLVFVLGGVNMSIIADLSEYYHNKSLSETQKRISYYVKFMSFFAIFITIFLLIFGKQILGLYGSEYENHYILLIVLIFAQLVNVLSGSNGWLLDISGNEKITLRTFLIAIVIKITFGIILIYLFGIIGMAFATLIAILFWNIYLVNFCVNKIKLNPSIFSLGRKF
jgi:O-antigen/teichoic acid export membrane protein